MYYLLTYVHSMNKPRHPSPFWPEHTAAEFIVSASYSRQARQEFHLCAYRRYVAFSTLRDSTFHLQSNAHASLACEPTHTTYFVMTKSRLQAAQSQSSQLKKDGFLVIFVCLFVSQYRGSSLSTIFGILKKSYYAKFVLVSTTQPISTSTNFTTQQFPQY